MKSFKNKKIVVDTCSSWIYIGKFVSEDELYICLEDVDAFDISETSLSKQEYLMMVKKDGIVPNRKMVKVLKSKIVAITLLDDIIEK
ncbi:MAG: hypothetical protein NC926_00240 [Candidatus Omnitrophica bacterium]|nr:hypothetical protein [Candidatus Omnitrophota bacterium]MCM8806379.1 hypothetical protein [Candidatus Omnitrophota bacterium]